MDKNCRSIAVLGAGSWGTALALVLARNGHDVRLWAHTGAHADALSRDRENRRYLPGFPFPESLGATADLEAALRGVRDVLIVTPSHVFGELLSKLAPLLSARGRLIWGTKGLDAASGGLLHSLVENRLPGHPMAVISGPSFAAEVARGLPTAVTIASADSQFAADMARCFHNDVFRPYTTDDLIGVELGGAVKNVLAVATGIADGLGLGANTRAGLITRGLAEIVRLGNALGARPETFMGLSGMGDLILTCTDDQSRNRRFGLALGRGASIEQALAEIGQTVEGVRTAREVHSLAQALNVEMPLCAQVYAVLAQSKSPGDAVRELMTRTLKDEAVDLDRGPPRR